MQILAFLAVCLIVAVPESLSAEPAADPSAEEAISPTDGVIKLFDGETLGDCYTFLQDTKREDPRKVFSVKDGLLHISGDGLGSIITNKPYRDYHLVLEYKFGDKSWHSRVNAARDSGLLIHSNGQDGGYKGIWKPSIEVQIIEGGVGDIVPVGGPNLDGKPLDIEYTCTVTRDRDGEPVWDPKGAKETFRRPNLKRINWYGRDPDWEDKKGVRGPHDVDSPHGEWTRIDVLSDGGHLETYVNGTKVMEATEVNPRQGQIQLQTELAEIDFRRWELWPLGKGPKPAPAEQE